MFAAGILTVSDRGSKGERPDGSGDAIRSILGGVGVEVIRYDVVPDEKESIAARLVQWADAGDVDVILTTGGTGLGPRDVTPEATLSVIERVVPGFSEAMRLESLAKTPMAMLSRAVAGTRRSCLIINLPGSPKAVRECLECVLPALPHAVETMKGEVRDCGSAG